MAYGLFLFIRDVCEGDLVGWIDQRLAAVPNPSSPDYPERLGQALIGPMRHVFGVSHKVLNMTLADLLIGADLDRSLWGLAGQHMIAIDTLIHNLLHRTGTWPSARRSTLMVWPATPLGVVPLSCGRSPTILTPAPLTQAFRPPFPGSCSTPFGPFAPKTG